MKTHIKLFIPGPTEVREDVLKEMTKPQIGHRTKEMSELYERIHNNLQKYFDTKNEVMVFTASGTGMMEGSIRNTIQSDVLHLTNGSFSERWLEVSKANGKNADSIKYEWGVAPKAVDLEERLAEKRYEGIALTHNETSTGVRTPIEDFYRIAHERSSLFLVDAVSSLAGDTIDINKTDVIFASSQKAFGLPPGLVITFISPEAMEKTMTVKGRGYYFDFISMKEDYDARKQIPATPAIPLFYSLDYQLERMLQEGRENRFRRHKEMAAMVQKWGRENFSLFAEPGYESVTLTVVNNTRNLNIENVRKLLRSKGMEISNGYGKLKEKTFRIAHMGDLTPVEVRELLDAMDEIIGLKQ